ncbi:MAG: family 20 glycosylhydrolase [Tannerella sp.]|jgi:hexosaminidase|nr:family 20 glycosylhydrolase [Tannerella sp.]
MRIIFLLILSTIGTGICNLFPVYAQETADSHYGIIPMPNKIIRKEGTFILKNNMSVQIPDDPTICRITDHFISYVKQTQEIQLQKTYKNGTICFHVDPELPDEEYQLEVDPEQIIIRANNQGTGFFYGVQTLSQLIREKTPVIPAVTISDKPRFKYRGSMLDMARHFMPKEFILQHIDLMAIYKFNYLHLHLTDDQGWRIEIKKYPRLTETGSTRPRTVIGDPNHYQTRLYDNQIHKGYYTQNDIREIVQYASERFITVIPEIEVPGHCSAALASYPDLSCGLENSYKVQDSWGVFEQVYCPKETTFEFLENVLMEIMGLFPGHYIHIGGDECPKKSWKQCPHCQELIKRENLANEEELQSWFIRRIEKFINSQGRDIIGWDEILEGGLAPNATVMSWRGKEGGIKAAQTHHNAIMTPRSFCYLNYYQEDPEFAPHAIGGFNPLDNTYNYDPIPEELTEKEQTYIIGAQANIWGEYISTPQQLEYMAFPRLLAMSEILWTEPQNKDFENFCIRLANNFPLLDQLKVNACRNFFEVNFVPVWNKETKRYEVGLSTFYPGATIYYTLDGNEPDVSSPLYQHPVVLSENTTIKAVATQNNKLLGKSTHKFFAVNPATGCKYQCQPEAGWEHLNKGFGLTDGLRAYPHDMRHWVSFYEDTVTITIDLNTERNICSIAFASLFMPRTGIWPSRGATVMLSSDGKNYKSATSATFHPDLSVNEVTRFPSLITLPVPDKARFVRIQILSGGLCPKGYTDEGKQSELAIDEIEIGGS